MNRLSPIVRLSSLIATRSQNPLHSNNHPYHLFQNVTKIHINQESSALRPFSTLPKPQTEKEFLVQLKTDPDTFGDAPKTEVIDEDGEPGVEERRLPSQRLSTKKYAGIIKQFIQQRKIKEALDFVEIKMIKEDRVKPENYIFNLLLGACGRVGYTKKAFSLYNQMKKRGLQITGGTYTALFNACANSPWPEDGLTRARHLQNIMIEKQYVPNQTNYNAMIKAFGRCGDLEAAFTIVDEMITNKICLKDDTFNFLLQACIQDKEAGFRHALLVWQKMKRKRIAPSIFTFNLMLHCIRDCGIGDTNVMNEVIKQLIGNQDQLKIAGFDNKLLLSSDENCKIIQNEVQFAESSNDAITCRPDLMAQVPTLGNIISVSEITKSEDRLLLVGGYKGYLNTMLDHNCGPDIKTFTQLLECLPSTAAEEEMLKMLKKLDIKPDVDFFNILIKRRSLRFEYEAARQVMGQLKKYKYKPNLITFGVLALGCKSAEDAMGLINIMKEHCYSLNTEILGTMLRQACTHKDFQYVLEIMELTLKENVKPNKIFMECLQNFKKECRDISNDKEHELSNSRSFYRGFRLFKMRYKTWLEEVEVEDSEDAHPWTQYRQTTETDVRHFKEKSVRFKSKHTSLFRVKTSRKKRY